MLYFKTTDKPFKISEVKIVMNKLKTGKFSGLDKILH